VYVAFHEWTAHYEPLTYVARYPYSRLNTRLGDYDRPALSKAEVNSFGRAQEPERPERRLACTSARLEYEYPLVGTRQLLEDVLRLLVRHPEFRKRYVRGLVDGLVDIRQWPEASQRSHGVLPVGHFTDCREVDVSHRQALDRTAMRAPVPRTAVCSAATPVKYALRPGLVVLEVLPFFGRRRLGVGPSQFTLA
jgi:hypothetical protein